MMTLADGSVGGGEYRDDLRQGRMLLILIIHMIRRTLEGHIFRRSNPRRRIQKWQDAWWEIAYST